ncbi:MAG TPA: hypothetical protein VIH90_06195 [Candidatus Saccharimonadales bacterium]
MVILCILIAHIILATAVVFGFIYRLLLTFKQKSYPIKGRKPMFAGAILLVLSGVVLSILGNLTITALCVSSLVLITVLIAGELGLLKVAKLIRVKSKN